MRRAQLQTMARTGTAHSSGALLVALMLLLLFSITGAQVLDTGSEEELSPRALRDFYPKGPNLTSEKQLVRSAFQLKIRLQALVKYILSTLLLGIRRV